jgi:hypothetical protein
LGGLALTAFTDRSTPKSYETTRRHAGAGCLARCFHLPWVRTRERLSEIILL